MALNKQLDLGLSATLDGADLFPAGAVRSISEIQEGWDVRGLAVQIGATDQALGLAFTLADVKGLFIWSDKDLTLETNSSSVPQESLAQKANTWTVWTPNSLFTLADLFAGNVTNVFVTNASGAIAQLVIGVLKNVP